MQVGDQHRPERPDGAGIFFREPPRHRGAARGRFGIGGHRDQGGVGHGGRRNEAGPRIAPDRKRGEPGPDHGGDRVGVEIADGHDGHEVRTVPVAIEPGEGFVREGLERLLVTDRKPHRIARAGEQDRELLVEHPRFRAQAQAPFLHHHAPLPVDLLRLEGDPGGPVLENVQRPREHARRIGRDLELVDGLVERRARVEMRPEAHPQALDEIDQRLLREALRSVERHVLDEMRQAALVIVLEHRAGIDHEPELGAMLGIPIGAHVPGEAVVEPALAHRGIERNSRRVLRRTASPPESKAQRAKRKVKRIHTVSFALCSLRFALCAVLSVSGRKRRTGVGSSRCLSPASRCRTGRTRCRASAARDRRRAPAPVPASCCCVPRRGGVPECS